MTIYETIGSWQKNLTAFSLKVKLALSDRYIGTSGNRKPSRIAAGAFSHRISPRDLKNGGGTSFSYPALLYLELLG